VERGLKRQRSLNNTRIKSLRQKLQYYNEGELESIPFLQKIQASLTFLDKNIVSVRKGIDNGEITPAELISYYSNIISLLIESIATASIDVENSQISKNIVTYSLFLKYQDIVSQREIIVSRVVSQKEITSDLFLEVSKLQAEKWLVLDITKGLIDEEMLSHYNRLSKTPSFSKMEELVKDILDRDIDEIKKLEEREFFSVANKYRKRLKELDDYISIRISEELSHMLDDQAKRESLLIVAFSIGIFVIILTTYTIYNSLREILFFGTIKIRSKILRVVTDIKPENIGNNSNEIQSLISLVSAFVKIIKESLEKIRTSFRDIVNLSNHLSESSETIVNHLQKQSQYLQDINLQMAVFLENIQTNQLSFENLKEIIEDSSAKINNLNLDVVYISYEVLSLKDLNRDINEKREGIKDVILDNITLLQRGDEESITQVVTSLGKLISIIDQQGEMIETKNSKLSNLTKTAVAIKKDAEANNANLNDVLGVITVLGYETKMITNDINQTVEDNSKFIEQSKVMVNKSEFVSSDVKMLNRYIVDLDKEFNRFRF
jgi:methyl-accepting chemotaxis protein